MPSNTPQPENQRKNILTRVNEQALKEPETYEEFLDSESEQEYLRHRRLKLIPALLFVATLISTFFVGICEWNPGSIGDSLAIDQFSPWIALRRMVLDRWQIGLTYMGCVVLILLLHEMGHFIATIIYRVPASFPIFLPFPINPIGTLGAVIAMHGTAKNRKQIFDIGLAGPLAGLVAAVPIAYWGVAQLDLNTKELGGMGFRLPLLMHYFATLTNVPGYQTGDVVWLSQLNPLFVAGWVGMLITGFNMMPIGQLDGGHVTYTLFGRSANLIAQAMIVLIIASMVYLQNYLLLVMVILLLFVGTEHPPTRDDSAPLGPFRYVLGILSLSIPVLCFPPLIFKINY